MDRTILIDTAAMTVAKVTDGPDSVKQAEYWADILKLESFYVCGLIEKHFEVFTEYELKVFAKNMEAKVDYTKLDRPRLINLLLPICQRVTVDETPLSELVTKLGHELPAKPDPTPVPEKGGRKKTPGKASSVPGRPKPGSTTEKVWVICDELYAPHKEGPAFTNDSWKNFRAEVISKCGEEGINPATAATQYSKWKRFTQAGGC